MQIETSDIINAVSIFVTFILGIISTVISVRNSKKLKDMETYKHILKINELKIDTKYKNNQLVIEEVHMLLTNIKNLSYKSECYLFRNEKSKKQKYKESIIEARESLIWVKKRINVLSVYMNKTIYSEIDVLFKLVREILDEIEYNDFNYFKNDILLEHIKLIEVEGIKIIQLIQNDNEQIIENNVVTKSSNL